MKILRDAIAIVATAGLIGGTVRVVFITDIHTICLFALSGAMFGLACYLKR